MDWRPRNPVTHYIRVKWTWPACGKYLISSPVIFQRLADELDRETIPVFIDEPDHNRGLGPGSDAKKAEAAFNNS
ncbi:hypothetical protein GWO62_08835 [Corynebacterium macginleyi]|uniref:hypothetical protein n=1 Tax=Corynebacterium macginleyi TaxID=38290 RepID=UPI001604F11D|nr:hypothetical protein [Corynebacterium macginleyi]MBK4153242.1 hypothetical protein [Corynebacterium macginleyi]MBK4156216.1 hypothetical protein [Corynebacterium macginleyi]